MLNFLLCKLNKLNKTLNFLQDSNICIFMYFAKNQKNANTLNLKNIRLQMYKGKEIFKDIPVL